MRNRLRRLEGRLPAAPPPAWDYAARSASLRGVLAECFGDPFPGMPNGREYLTAVAAWSEPPADITETDAIHREIYRVMKQVTAV